MRRGTRKAAAMGQREGEEGLRDEERDQIGENTSS